MDLFGFFLLIPHCILRADLHHGWGGEATQPTSDEAEGGVPNGMAGLGLPYPKKIDESLPANMVCGLHNLPERMQDWVK